VGGMPAILCESVQRVQRHARRRTAGTALEGLPTQNR
jgi:hypothetical protein